MMVGHKRMLIGRISAALSFACGVIGLLAGLTDHTWKMMPIGWFTAGCLVALIALFVLVDGAIAFQKPRT